MPTKPVGTMCFVDDRGGCAGRKRTIFPGNIEETREQAVGVALQGAIDLLNKYSPGTGLKQARKPGLYRP